MAPRMATYHLVLNDSSRIKKPSMSRNTQFTGSGKPSVSTLCTHLSGVLLA